MSHARTNQKFVRLQDSHEVNSIRNENHRRIKNCREITNLGPAPSIVLCLETIKEIKKEEKRLPKYSKSHFSPT